MKWKEENKEEEGEEDGTNLFLATRNEMNWDDEDVEKNM